MAELESEFKQFLESYKLYPELTDSHMFESMKEEERDKKIAAAKSEHSNNFEKWKKLPKEIIYAHPESVPQWILDVTNEADPARLLVLKENPDIRTRQELDEKVKEVEEENRRQQMTSEEKEAEDRANYEKEREAFENIVSAAAILVLAKPIIEAGYTEKAAEDLAKERLFRDSLFEKAGGTKLSDKHRGILHQSRLRTFEIIKEEWERHLPERALVHELSLYNRGKTTDKEATQKVSELVDLIRTNNRYPQLDRYLRHPLVKAKIRHFDPDKKEILEALDRILFAEKHRTPEEMQAQKIAGMKNTKDLPYDVRKLFEKDQNSHEKSNEPRSMLAPRPRVRFKSNTNQNT